MPFAPQPARAQQKLQASGASRTLAAPPADRSDGVKTELPSAARKNGLDAEARISSLRRWHSIVAALECRRMARIDDRPMELNGPIARVGHRTRGSS